MLHQAIQGRIHLQIENHFYSLGKKTFKSLGMFAVLFLRRYR
jgi:hypothetical protein